MDDKTALRLEHVKVAYHTTERALDHQSRFHLAILAVALTSVVTVLVAGLGGQLRSDVALALAVPLGGIVASKILALRAWDARWRAPVPRPRTRSKG